LLLGLVLLAQQIAHDSADPLADGRRRRGWPPQRDSRFPNFPPVQIRQKKAEEVRPNLNRRYRTSLRPETQYVRRSATGRISFTDRLNQTREPEVGDYIGNRRSAQPGSANQIGLRAWPQLAKQPQKDLSIGLAEKRRPSDQYAFFRHFALTGILGLDAT
jgi:hypothetical protein